MSSLGYCEGFRSAFLEHASDHDFPARVAVEHRGALVLFTERGELDADVSGALRHGATERLALPAVGDWVSARASPAGERAVVTRVLPRRSQFVRRAAGRREDAQVVGANVDVLFPVTPLDDMLNLRRLERTLAMAMTSGARPVVLLTKSDLEGDVPARVLDAVRIAPDTPVHAVSAVTSAGMDPVRAYFQGGTTIALIGPSGAGKSTLVNALVGSHAQEVSALAADGRGRHTTTHRALVPIPGGGVVLDTPGMRELRLWDEGEGVDLAFADVTELAARCHFADCRHEGEPACAVAEALASGELDPARYGNYAKLRHEAEAHAVRSDARANADRRKKMKVIMRAQRAKSRLPRG